MKDLQYHKDDKLDAVKHRRDTVMRMQDVKKRIDVNNNIEKRIQPKLEIGEPNDKYEQEADAVANKVVSGGDSSVKNYGNASGIQRSYDKEGEENTLMAKSENGGLKGTEQLQAKLDSSKGGGQSLDAGTKNEMENKMGADLSDVKIHTDSNAHEIAEGINAKAFTYGQDIYFNKGNFNTNTNEGKGLLTHELTHTQQQKNGLSRKIQRSIKFEFQTGNEVWAVKNSGSPDPVILPRKYAPNTVGYKKGNEAGDQPAYLTLGKHGKPSRKAGTYFVPAEGPPIMKKAKSSEIDESLPAQFVKNYRFTIQVSDDLNEILNKKPTNGQLEFVSETDNDIALGEGKYNPNTFEFRYFNKNDLVMSDDTLLAIHLNSDGIFKKKHEKYQKVGRDYKEGIDKDLDAQFVQIYRVTADSKGTVDYNGTLVSVEQAGKTINNYEKWVQALKKDPDAKKTYNSGTYEKKYYMADQFVEGTDTLKDDAVELEAHMSKDETELKNKKVKYMEKKKLPRADQTAMELQAESHGVLEFETPKWFDDWEELKLRIQDAVDITKAFNDQAKDISDNTKVVNDPAITSVINPTGTGIVVEWPIDYSYTQLKNLVADNRRLVVNLIDQNWNARIQSSYEVSLSQYSKVLDVGHFSGFPNYVQYIIDSSEKIFNIAFDTVKAITTDKPKFLDGKTKKTLDLANVNKPDMANLQGFLQMISNYIIYGQLRGVNIAKNIADVMSRTSFYSIYHEILSEPERLLFQYMVTNKIITKEIGPFIDQYYSDQSMPDKVSSSFLAGNAYVYPSGHSAGQGPKIDDWLVSIYAGYKAYNTTSGKNDIQINNDLMSPPESGSRSMGAHKTGYKTGQENKVQLELRYSDAFLGGQDRPASEWVQYAQDLFHWAAKFGDNPDNPATPDKNEAAETGLKNSP